jgi:hypothetical protein
MNGLFLELLASLEKGEPISQEMQAKIAAENGKLVRLAAGVLGKIPTHALANGEFSHPLVLANLLNAVLDDSGFPLTKAQKDAISRIGGGYDDAYERLQQGYTKDTPELEKVVDELSSADQMNRMRSTLSRTSSRRIHPDPRPHA